MPKPVADSSIAAARLIQGLLAALFETIPNASRVGLSLLGADTSEPAPVLCRAGRRKAFEPDWDVVLPSLQAGQCCLLHAINPPLGRTRRRQPLPQPPQVLFCPVSVPPADLFGALWIEWDGTDRLPREAALTEVKRCGLRLGSQIAAVLDLCGHASAAAMRRKAA